MLRVPPPTEECTHPAREGRNGTALPKLSAARIDEIQFELCRILGSVPIIRDAIDRRAFYHGWDVQMRTHSFVDDEEVDGRMRERMLSGRPMSDS